jgi:hypothetical protein
VNERVAAGVPYKDMLKEAGLVSGLFVVFMLLREVSRFFNWPADPDMQLYVQIGVTAAILIAYGFYVRSLGRPMFIFLVIIMIPLAITELGTDSWITPLMEGEMKQLALNAGWVLVYTSLIMTVLRFYAGPIVHAASPIGLLAISAAVAALGLVTLSYATGFWILAAATLYGFGKTFFWPTMLGVVSEQFPRGGALTLNAISGIGMLGVGVIGAALLGNIQDREIDKKLLTDHPQLRNKVVAPERISVFGTYRPLDKDKANAVSLEEREVIKDIQAQAKKNALFTVAIFPCFMLACYLILIVYFQARGGYKAEVLTGHAGDEAKFTGGLESGMEA